MTLPPTITSRSNARVKALRAAAGGEASNPGDLLAIEGENLIAEALRSGVRFDTVFVREGSENVLQRPALTGLDAANWASLSKDVFASAVDTASPQGIAALIAIPELPAMDFQKSSSVVLVIESLQDPGNLGTLLRSAEAFGVKQIITTRDTVSHWNPKTVRASAGSVFRVSLARIPLAETSSILHTHGYRIFAAVAEARGATAAMDAALASRSAILIGNEGAGLSAEALALADERVHIPCMTESLNAAIAGSTLMYEALRQRIAATIPSGAEGTA